MLEAIHRGAPAAPATPTVILCHGFGANGADLAPLADELLPDEEICWYFPQAPYRFQTTWGDGRAWFPRDPVALESFMSGEIHASLAGSDPPGLRQAGEELVEFIREVGCDPARTVLGGFSQGTMVATETVLALADRPAGLLLFSGGFIAAERWKHTAAQRPKALAGLPVASYHGEEDPVLSFVSGRALAGFLEGCGAQVRFTSFHGGHGIPGMLFPSVVGELSRMLGLC